MASLDSLDTLVRRKCPGCQLTRVELDGDPVGRLAAVILRAQLEITKPFVVYVATGGPPRSSSHPGLDPAPIVWSTAEAELTTALARTLDTGSLARLNLERASTALCLHILADFAASRGFTQAPRRLRALADGSGMNALLMEPTTQEAREGDLTEMVMAASWFGLLHEAGHVWWSTSPPHRVLTDDDLDAQIRAASADHPQARQSESLDLDHLHQEVCADVACVQWLWSTIKTMMPLWTGRDANPIRFAQAVAATFCAFTIINLCQQVADDCAAANTFADQIAAEEDQFALRIGFQVRLTIAIDLAIKLAVRDLGEDELAQSGLRIVLFHLRRRFDEMLAGFERAAPRIQSVAGADAPRRPAWPRHPARTVPARTTAWLAETWTSSGLGTPPKSLTTRCSMISEKEHGSRGRPNSQF